MSITAHLHHAILTQNIQALDSLLHDDLLFILPSGQTITKAQDLETYKSGNLKIEKLESLEEQQSEIGDTVVTVSIVELKGNYAGNAFEGTFKYIRVWKQFGEQWKVIAGSGMQV